ncbi:MAG: hypothetical protein IT435_09165 [Phycisphaerales bacterium]|nr:hypothetical protein [Phycisphaerales bacterium]
MGVPPVAGGGQETLDDEADQTHTRAVVGKLREADAMPAAGAGVEPGGESAEDREEEDAACADNRGGLRFPADAA